MRRTNLDHFFRTILFAMLATIVFDGPAHPTGGGVPNPDRLDGGLIRRNDLGPLDKTFTLGKSIYMGRGRKVRGLRVCLSVKEVDGDGLTAIRLSRRVLKPFKGGSIIALTSRLVDCRAPKSQVALILGRTEFRALVYFMNKRFRLDLKS